MTEFPKVASDDNQPTAARVPGYQEIVRADENALLLKAGADIGQHQSRTAPFLKFAAGMQKRPEQFLNCSLPA